MLQRNDMVEQRRWCARGFGVMALGAVIAACSDSPPGSPGGGTLTGQVVVSGPLRRAAVSIDQLETSDPAMAARDHVTDTTTDDDGRFSVDVGSYSGLLLVRATGGSFVDLSTGVTIQLDTDNGLASFVPLALGEQRDDVLVSPIGHLIVARTRSSTEKFSGAPHPVVLAEQAASEHLNRHFGNVDWTRQKLGSLDVVATSPTEPIRAALVQAALSELAHDIALAALRGQVFRGGLAAARWLGAAMAQQVAHGGLDRVRGRERRGSAGLEQRMGSTTTVSDIPGGHLTASAAAGPRRPRGGCASVATTKREPTENLPRRSTPRWPREKLLGCARRSSSPCSAPTAPAWSRRSPTGSPRPAATGRQATWRGSPASSPASCWSPPNASTPTG